jgi:hypothetical protein
VRIWGVRQWFIRSTGVVLAAEILFATSVVPTFVNAPKASIVPLKGRPVAAKVLAAATTSPTPKSSPSPSAAAKAATRSRGTSARATGGRFLEWQVIWRLYLPTSSMRV